jgi:lipid A 3-O-deacylase
MNIKKISRSALLVFALGLGSTIMTSHASEIAAFKGNSKSINTQGVIYRFDTWKTLNWGNWGNAVVFGEAEIGKWRGQQEQLAGRESNRTIIEVGFKPVLRNYPLESTSFRPYLDAGLGFHLLSHTAINLYRRLPGAFQFGEVLGVGAEFCAKLACAAGVRLQHVSNGGLKAPNFGITFSQILFGYRF